VLTPAPSSKFPQSFGGERHSTYSHGKILFATPESVGREIAAPGGPSDLRLVGEWERKIMATQGRRQPLVPKVSGVSGLGMGREASTGGQSS
jgi:hypothetical protein